MLLVSCMHFLFSRNLHAMKRSQKHRPGWRCMKNRRWSQDETSDGKSINRSRHQNNPEVRGCSSFVVISLWKFVADDAYWQGLATCQNAGKMLASCRQVARLKMAVKQTSRNQWKFIEKPCQNVSMRLEEDEQSSSKLKQCTATQMHTDWQEKWKFNDKHWTSTGNRAARRSPSGQTEPTIADEVFASFLLSARWRGGFVHFCSTKRQQHLRPASSKRKVTNSTMTRR